MTIGESLLRQQKRFAGLVAGRTGLFHHDLLFAEQGMLKVDDLYRQQLRVNAWQFWNGRLPENQAALLRRTGEVHGHATRSARSGLFPATREQRSVGYWVPMEWGELTEEQRGAALLAAFKRGSRGGFLAEYGSSVCSDQGCEVCGGAGGGGG